MLYSLRIQITANLPNKTHNRPQKPKRETRPRRKKHLNGSEEQCRMTELAKTKLDSSTDVAHVNAKFRRFFTLHPRQRRIFPRYLYPFTHFPVDFKELSSTPINAHTFTLRQLWIDISSIDAFSMTKARQIPSEILLNML